MTYSPDASREYLKNAVLTASAEQLQLMLLDGAIRYATRGLEAMNRKDLEGAYFGFERAQRIVLELGNGLRREVNPELVDQMAALYDFVFRRLVEAGMQREPQAVEDALRILRHQRETWALLIEKLQRETHGTTPTAPDATTPAPTQNDSAEQVSGFVAEG